MVIKLLEKSKVISLILTILITIEIFYFSSLEGIPGAGGSVWFARIYHFSVFFLFSFFLFVLIKGNKKIKPKYILAVLFISIIHAFLDEFHQIFVPGRDANITDILTDTIGVFLAVIIYSWASRKKLKS